MRFGRLLAAALLTVPLACLASSCSADVADAPPSTWCARDFGNVRSSTFHDPLDPPVACSQGEICAFVGDNWTCCDLSDPDCAGDSGGTEDGLYCGNDGWERLPMRAPGTICAPNETCAMRKGSGCQAVCCDPKKDPDCANPSQSCALL